MRFRLWHLMLLVLVAALAVMGYRLWTQPVIITQSVHFDSADVSAPAPGLIQIRPTAKFIDHEKNGAYRWKVIVRRDADLVWEHSFDEPQHQQQSLKGQLATFKLAPIQIQVAPGVYDVQVQLFEDRGVLRGKAMNVGTGQRVIVD
jgi:hypothetical protein